MDRLKASLAAKVTAMMLVIVSIILLITCFAGMVALDSFGIYRTRREDILQDGYEEMCRRYSVAAMAAYLDQYDAEKLEDTNFRYGIFRAEDLNEIDLSDSDSCIAGNMGMVLDKQDVYFADYDINEDTEFEIGSGSILDASDHIYTETYEDVSYVIDGWYYNTDTGSFYVRSKDGLFPIPDDDGSLMAPEYGEGSLRNADELIVKKGGQNAYIWTEDAEVYFYGPDLFVDMDEIPIVNSTEMAQLGEVYKESPAYFEGDDTFYMQKEKPSEHYIVASYVQLPLTGEQSFADGDRFVQVKLLIDFAYRMRYTVIAVVVLSLIVLIAAFSFLMAAAGHRKGQEDVVPYFMDHVPLDLYFAGVFLAELLVAYLVVVSLDAILGGWSRSDLSGVVSASVIVVCAGSLEVLMGIAWCMSFAVHVKLGKWWRHTLVYIIAGKCLHLLVRGMRFCGYVIFSLCRSVTLLWKAWIALGALAFLEVAAMEISGMDPEYVVFWLLEKAVLYPVVIIQLLQMNRLQKGAQRIANGQLDAQIDTRHMFWEFRKHGEYLNDIGHGINCAVNERMKSEHFKTELITNVSHDIKTPLTSIINYVDLLQKEEIDNPTVQEYLEVLHRQSARLKKLIEDLMEASKASTGSLSVVMEKCDAGVTLVQTIGEFEEKLMAEQIELQIKKPDADIYIEADHRHLWRVFDNLMNNICKYAQPLTRAYVNLEQNGQQAVITFRNISRYQLNISSEELMERFVRGDSSRNTEGSGLGISIAKSLTELMDGKFELVVDGDLFKVVLTFPLYGTMKMHKEHRTPDADFDRADFEKKEVKDSHVLDGLAAGIQNAGAYAAGFGQGVADKTGRMFRRAGRFAHHVRQAAEQVKAEEEAQLRAAEQVKEEKEARLRAAEQVKAEKEARLQAAEQAKAEKETRLQAAEQVKE